MYHSNVILSGNHMYTGIAVCDAMVSLCVRVLPAENHSVKMLEESAAINVLLSAPFYFCQGPDALSRKWVGFFFAS